jgi:hypothetical protein
MLAMLMAGGVGTAHAITPAPVVAYPTEGTGAFSVAGIGGPRSGTPGKVVDYRVAVEGGILGISPDGFAADVASALVDVSAVRLVADGEPFDFTVYLATPATRDDLCGDGFDRYTSCRHGDRVVINVERWELGEPEDGVDLATYRRDVLTAETGEELRGFPESG